MFVYSYKENHAIIFFYLLKIMEILIETKDNIDNLGGGGDCVDDYIKLYPI